MAATGCRRGSGSRLRSGPRGTLPHTSALLCSLSASQVASISWPVLTRGEWRTRPALSHPRSPLALPRGPHEMLSVLRPHGGGHQGLSSFRGWFHNGSCGSSQMTGCAPGSGRRCGFKGRGLSVGPKPQFPLAAWWGGVCALAITALGLSSVRSRLSPGSSARLWFRWGLQPSPSVDPVALNRLPAPSVSAFSL